MGDNVILVLSVYVAIGAVFAVPFVWKGVARLDPSAEQGSWGFRVLILPGTVALWPLLLAKWLRAPRGPS